MKKWMRTRGSPANLGSLQPMRICRTMGYNGHHQENDIWGCPEISHIYIYVYIYIPETCHFSEEPYSQSRVFVGVHT